ncbi:MAG: RNA-binding cell elongation regulator Jag/EloR [Bacillota bacterium]|uniref:RNA-binding protein KhpB n=1 Tax=Virgibacillus salarius TaxID=447199 RepID=A0A941DWM1_9BACI|nr:MULTISPECIES: RNA-binding cell elongation regulator Jag/EloR [Bacillaceae]NAZ09532.1 KH domain-containing protein [Agaribacter marinus]MBR7796822.1 protein jag [Virgibacillus salarius]MCC2250120.1 protein jag [Virgibacillus sp. AGTR]MDY7045588.1 RNA-binding cell elongation regulator Jag/EloR [Virgibacillus sp. M23]QRZ19003.1 protein jag [Virgibacillus sp. AGTR]
MREITASGQTVEEAVQSALEQLNTTRDQVEIDVIDEGKKGLLGVFGSKRAFVKVSTVKNQIEETEKYLQQIIKQMHIDATIFTKVEENHVTYDVQGDNIALLIGKRGQTLNALQYLLHLVINKEGKQYYTVTLDAEGYRGRRKETLESLALKMADKAIRMNKKVALEPMPAFERKIIHSVLQANEEVSTYSDGKEPHRHIVIQP